MRKNLLVFLVTIVLLSACAGPTPYPTLEPQPTLAIEYQVVGSTKNTYMVVVNPVDNAKRDRLEEIGVRLCQSTIKCKVWFWDDINKADTSYPVDPDKEQTLIAEYTSDLYTQSSELKVFTLGDAR
jgi:hypothetical protein